MPRVSVYLPTRNRASLVPRAVASVLAQDHADWELLIVDDASEDSTPAVLAELARRDPRIRLFRNERPGGAPAARNVAIRAAAGTFVTGLDDDDEFLPHRLSALLRAFDPRYAFVCSGFWLVEARHRRARGDTDRVVTLDEQLHVNVVGTQVLTQTERVRALGGFDETMPAWQDYDLWTRLMERHGPALRIGDPSYVQHVEPGVTRITQSGLEGARRYIDKHAARMSASQLVSQRLEVFMLEGRRMSLADAAAFARPGTWRRALRYLVTSNVPALRRVATGYREWRSGGPRSG